VVVQILGATMEPNQLRRYHTLDPIQNLMLKVTLTKVPLQLSFPPRCRAAHVRHVGVNVTSRCDPPAATHC
jgi:hypothetical protein